MAERKWYTPEEVREIMYKEIPIETKFREILDILEGKQYLTFSEIAKIQTSRSAMVVCFMAVLELVKNKQVVAIVAIIMTIVLDLVHFASVNHL